VKRTHLKAGCEPWLFVDEMLCTEMIDVVCIECQGTEVRERSQTPSDAGRLARSAVARRCPCVTLAVTQCGTSTTSLWQRSTGPQWWRETAADRWRNQV